MDNLRNEVRDIIFCNRKIESFNDLNKHQKERLAVAALSDFDNIDAADILLYRNSTLSSIAQKFITRQITGDQFANRLIQMMSDGVRSTIDEIISEEREELSTPREYKLDQLARAV